MGYAINLIRKAQKDVEKMRRLRTSGVSLREIARRFNTSSGYVCGVVNGKERKWG